jgi:hypothetical protein
VTHALAELIVNTTANNPRLVPSIIFLFLGATALNHGLRAAWPFACMPRWARVLAGVCAPFALNFYDIGRRARR